MTQIFSAHRRFGGFVTAKKVSYKQRGVFGARLANPEQGERKEEAVGSGRGRLSTRTQRGEDAGQHTGRSERVRRYTLVS